MLTTRDKELEDVQKHLLGAFSQIVESASFTAKGLEIVLDIAKGLPLNLVSAKQAKNILLKRFVQSVAVGPSDVEATFKGPPPSNAAQDGDGDGDDGPHDSQDLEPRSRIMLKLRIEKDRGKDQADAAK
jgi:hypothetical protein